VGNWDYPDSGLSHLLLMANVVVEHPFGRFSPFAGAGVGGDWSFLSFGNNYYYYWYSEPDGEGSDFVLSYQFFAGLKYRLSNNASLGVMYRYVGTAEQKWDVDWWNSPDFTIGVDAVRMHVISLVFSASF
jgi:opacity protein-like surface antigen